MRAYWIHYTAIGMGEPPRFGIIESDSAGRQNVISPPGRVESASEAVRLLVSKGVDPAQAKDRVAVAMRESIAHLYVVDRDS
jgi:hypothetical protein